MYTTKASSCFALARSAIKKHLPYLILHEKISDVSSSYFPTSHYLSVKLHQIDPASGLLDTMEDQLEAKTKFIRYG